MVREFGIVQNNTQWPNGKSSIFIYIFGIPFIDRENPKKNYFLKTMERQHVQKLEQIMLLLRMT